RRAVRPRVRELEKINLRNAGIGSLGSNDVVVGIRPVQVGEWCRDRYRRRARIDDPGMACRGRVSVAGLVDRADLEGVTAFGQSGRENVGARARRPAAAVDPALERRTGL